MKKKTGGRKKGTPNKISSKVKEKLSQIIDETIDSLDISVMTENQKIKLLQIGLQYIIPKIIDRNEINSFSSNFEKRSIFLYGLL